jgi:hypothetical protein
MATFRINQGLADSRVVTAESFTVNGEFMEFHDEDNHVVLSLRADSVQTVEQVNGEPGTA